MSLSFFVNTYDFFHSAIELTNYKNGVVMAKRMRTAGLSAGESEKAENSCAS
jgi:hypothetical protein